MVQVEKFPVLKGIRRLSLFFLDLSSCRAGSDILLGSRGKHGLSADVRSASGGEVEACVPPDRGGWWKRRAFVELTHTRGG